MCNAVQCWDKKKCLWAWWVHLCVTRGYKKIITAATTQTITHQQLATGNDFGFEGWHIPWSCLAKSVWVAVDLSNSKDVSMNTWKRHIKVRTQAAGKRKDILWQLLTVTFYTHTVNHLISLTFLSESRSNMSIQHLKLPQACLYLSWSWRKWIKTWPGNSLSVSCPKALEHLKMEVLPFRIPSFL